MKHAHLRWAKEVDAALEGSLQTRVVTTCDGRHPYTF